MSIEIGPSEARGIQNPPLRTGRVGPSAAPKLDVRLRPPVAEVDGEERAHDERGLSTPTLSDELVQALGLPWTRHNPVWGPSALDRLRALQHTLMKKAFSLPQEDRAPTLQAVKSLEIAVNLRLRLEEAQHIEQAVIHSNLRQSTPTQSPSTNSVRTAV